MELRNVCGLSGRKGRHVRIVFGNCCALGRELHVKVKIKRKAIKIEPKTIGDIIYILNSLWL